jgi:hypothetical protein
MLTPEEKEKRLGGAWLRLAGCVGSRSSKESPATMEDAHNILEALIYSEDFRERAGRLYSMLSQETDAQSMKVKKEAGRALIIVMARNITPPEVDPGPQELFIETSAEFFTLCGPLPNSSWNAHVKAKYRPSGAAEEMSISPFFAEIVKAIERMFGCVGHLIQTPKETHTAQAVSP